MQIQINTDRHIEGNTKLTDEVESIVQQALARYGDRITRVEVFLSDENSSQKFGDSDKRCVIEARLGGLQPVAVSHHGSALHQAVGGAASKLEKTLKRTLGRKGSMFKRRAHGRAELTAAGPLLQHDVETGKHEDFKNVLCPLLGHLGNHARNELRIMEANGTLYPGEVIFADLLDEVVARAWLQFADRPGWMTLDLWLTKIVDEILDERIHQAPRFLGASDQPSNDVLPQKLPQVDDQEWWLWLLGEDEPMIEDNVDRNQQTAWIEEFHDAEDLIYRIHALLGELPKEKRRAFVLNVLEAYDLSEIAMLQNRPEADIKADVEAGRNMLRVRLRTGNASQVSSEEPLEVPAGPIEKI